VFYDCWWLMRNRHLDQVIMCCVYAVCKWQKRGILFHTIVQHYCALPFSITSGAGIDYNFEDKMEMVNSCDVDCLDSAQDCCLCEGAGNGSTGSAGDAAPVKGTVIEFYNKEFLPRTQDFLTELQNDGGKHGTLITEFPSSRRINPKKRKMVDRTDGGNSLLMSAPPEASSNAPPSVLLADHIEGSLPPLERVSAHVKELIELAKHN